MSLRMYSKTLLLFGVFVCLYLLTFIFRRLNKNPSLFGACYIGMVSVTYERNRSNINEDFPDTDPPCISAINLITSSLAMGSINPSSWKSFLSPKNCSNFALYPIIIRILQKSAK